MKEGGGGEGGECERGEVGGCVVGVVKEGGGEGGEGEVGGCGVGVVKQGGGGEGSGKEGEGGLGGRGGNSL